MEPWEYKAFHRILLSLQDRAGSPCTLLLPADSLSLCEWRVLWPWYDFISYFAHTRALEAALPQAQHFCSQGKVLALSLVPQALPFKKNKYPVQKEDRENPPGTLCQSGDEERLKQHKQMD